MQEDGSDGKSQALPGVVRGGDQLLFLAFVAWDPAKVSFGRTAPEAGS
jgi:hypothetical protein